MTAKLSICVVNRNGGDELVETLDSVVNQGDIVGEILLVDNASKDGSPAKALDRHPSVELIQMGANRGPAVARNAGFRAARYERILFVDSDVRLDAGCAALLCDELERSDQLVAAMPRVRFEETNAIQCDGADSHYLGFMLIEHHVGSETQRIGSIVSACMLLHRSRWGQSDPFDAAFFIYYEDHDFGFRARSAGWELAGVSSAVCYHGRGTQGLSYRPGRPYPSGRVEFLIRNRWQLLLKNYELRSFCVLGPPLLLYEAIQFAGIVKKGWFSHWKRAAIWIVANRGMLLEKRRAAAEIRRVRDRKLLRGGGLPFHSGLLTSGRERAALRCIDAIFAAYWRLASRIL